MSNVALNPVSLADTYSVPTVYAPNPVALNTALQSGTNGFDANPSLQTLTPAVQTLTAEASASFAEPLSSGNSGQMAGFLSYLNQGPTMHAESGSMNNLSALFGP
ncbi:hypothetical protein [Pseudochelatococcus sp. G4_1912]|uniref:hypothetical protein n=1 Tax=Pseudochelatococcus sp. G4_1912 TaxID=3114288 RepID=UPI0039C62752